MHAYAINAYINIDIHNRYSYVYICICAHSMNLYFDIRIMCTYVCTFKCMYRCIDSRGVATLPERNYTVTVCW